MGGEPASAGVCVECAGRLTQRSHIAHDDLKYQHHTRRIFHGGVIKKRGIWIDFSSVCVWFFRCAQQVEVQRVIHLLRLDTTHTMQIRQEEHGEMCAWGPIDARPRNTCT